MKKTKKVEMFCMNRYSSYSVTHLFMGNNINSKNIMFFILCLMFAGKANGLYYKHITIVNDNSKAISK